MDTGSSLVWIPCTHSYLCRDCSFPSQPTLQNPPFIPKFSSSSKLVGCANPKCSWLSDSDSLQSNCPGCHPNSPLNCSQTCSPYFVLYGSGSTGGLLLSETLVFPEKRITDFGVGCSLFSTRMPAGIAGFGRGPASLPSQLGLSRFAYCLLSHRFDDTTNSSSLVLDGGSGSGSEGVWYTPFLQNPTAGNPSFSEYYYVGLRKVTVGGKSVKIPYRYLRPGSDGNGGTIVDSGTTFTFMERHLFEPVASEFVTQVGSRYKTVPELESRVGLRPCFNVSGDISVTLPKLAFHFKGGAVMELPLANYFSLVGDPEVACLTIVTDGGSSFSGGPSIMLGNFQQQNFYMEYDLKKLRLGFRRQLC
ncbi:putative aspartyl protease [Cinnamomum micranthum f. kanehirae]|uniref:Putative aspartyl protease n=1 Tax=Cinnamomum micranthum f. kanehirae TaxID=337451 RepID=A0A3S3P7H6_9MAGN|nr:putative aspartyl protease [Cinnamomum micranthum f. kanehirae]